MRETDTHYFFYKHEFGQWTKRDILDRHGLTYNCCEQYMMFQKAMLFGDKCIANEVLETDSPYEQKELGREVSNFDIGIWNQHRFMIVWEANMLKFTQHQDLQDRLVSTTGKQLVEATKNDKIWGCGIDFSDDRVLDPDNWTGLNLLGKAVTSVREAIINGI